MYIVTMKKYSKYQKLKGLIRQKKITIRDFAGLIGMSEPGFHNAVKKDTFKNSTILEMARVLGVHPNELFESSGMMVHEPPEKYGKNESELLFDAIADIDKLKLDVTKIKERLDSLNK